MAGSSLLAIMDKNAFNNLGQEESIMSDNIGMIKLYSVLLLLGYKCLHIVSSLTKMDSTCVGGCYVPSCIML